MIPCSALPWGLTNATRLGTIDPEMGAMKKPRPAEWTAGSVLFDKTRRNLLALLFTHADQAYYLRELARQTGSGMGAVQREVRKLSEAGILRREVRGRQVYYQANPDCPVFAELKGLVVKTLGVADVLRAALRPLSGRVRVALVYGSFARGREKSGSDVDLMVVGEAGFAEVVAALSPAQEALGREINPSVYPVAEFRAKVAAGHYFLKRVLQGPRVWVVGSESELARLAG